MSADAFKNIDLLDDITQEELSKFLTEITRKLVAGTDGIYRVVRIGRPMPADRRRIVNVLGSITEILETYDIDKGDISQDELKGILDYMKTLYYKL